MAPPAIVAAGSGRVGRHPRGHPVVGIAGSVARVGGGRRRAAAAPAEGCRAGGHRSEDAEAAVGSGSCRGAAGAPPLRRRRSAAAASGPIRDRLAEIGTRAAARCTECWRVARRGDTLVDGVRSLDLRRARSSTPSASARGQPGANAPRSTRPDRARSAAGLGPAARRVSRGRPRPACSARRPPGRSRGARRSSCRCRPAT